MKQQNRKWVDEVWKNKITSTIAGLLFIFNIIRNESYPGFLEYIALLIGMLIGSYLLSITIMTIRWLIIRKKK